LSSATPGPPPRRAGFKWLALAVGLLSSLVLAELVLQLAAAVASPLAQREAQASPDGEAVTILSVGDSHTYGLPLPREDAYPAQLEAALTARHPNTNLRVINLGTPGLNSTFVANRLERQMFQLRPELVIVWVGVNNMWNVAETLGWERPDPWRPLRRALQNLRLFRLVSIAWFSQTGHQYDPDARGGWFEGELPPAGFLEPGKRLKDRSGNLATDLERMVRLAHGLDTPILFVAYPLPGAVEINQTIERVAGRMGVAVIETRESLQRAVNAGHGHAALIDERAGPHPSRLLYGFVVEDMVGEVEATLSAWHGLEWVAPGFRGRRSSTPGGG